MMKGKSNGLERSQLIGSRKPEMAVAVAVMVSSREEGILIPAGRCD